jgi:hypothetical protein
MSLHYFVRLIKYYYIYLYYIDNKHSKKIRVFQFFDSPLKIGIVACVS